MDTIRIATVISTLTIAPIILHGRGVLALARITAFHRIIIIPIMVITGIILDIMAGAIAAITVVTTMVTMTVTTMVTTMDITVIMDYCMIIITHTLLKDEIMVSEVLPVVL